MDSCDKSSGFAGSESTVCYDKLVVLCKVLSRDLKDHEWCKSTAIKLLKLKLTDVYFSYS